RDLVSRASFLEVSQGRGTPNGGVWIDVSHLGAEVVERNFRGMVRRCRDFGRDLARGPVEVGPTAHFMMGGVVVDPDCRTAIEGLFAAGEDTGGVHGANRLGGNGVAESTVFGGIAGDVMAAFVAGRPMPRVSEAALEAAAARCAAPLGRESRGARWRRDFPVPAATPPVCVRVQGRDGAPLVWAEPVAMTRARPPAGARRPVAVEIGD